MAQLDWGLGERLSARLLLLGRDITATGMVEFDSAGLGDIEAWARWGLGPEEGRGGGAVAGGLAFPTGREGDPSVTDENIVFGAGDYSLLLSVEGFRRLTSSQTLFGLARYRYPMGSGSNGYRFGDDFGWAATWRWNPGAGPIGLLLGASGQHLGRDELNGADVLSRGGRMNHLSAGVSFPAGKRTSIGLVGQHLIDQDMRGDQLLAQWNFVAAWTLAWGQHLHEPPSTSFD
ncbi:MAG: hypothetical protein O7A63_03330 [Acidobacteria bacterium]|nr:hypothetical protein [Acidobacteriota bacterium]